MAPRVDPVPFDESVPTRVDVVVIGGWIIGISETHGGDAIAAGFESLKSKIIGADPYTLCGSLLPMIENDPQGTSLDRSQTYHVPGENPLDAAARLCSAIEIACLDLIGKSVGKPVCDLLGGRARSEVLQAIRLPLCCLSGS